MQLSLDLVPYKKLPADMAKARLLSEYLIGEAMQRRFPQGLPRMESKLYAKIQNQFFVDSEVIVIDEAALGMIQEALDKAELPPHMSAWKWALLDYLGDSQRNEDASGN